MNKTQVKGNCFVMNSNLEHARTHINLAPFGRSLLEVESALRRILGLPLTRAALLCPSAPRQAEALVHF